MCFKTLFKRECQGEEGRRGGGDVSAYAGCHGDRSLRIGSLPSHRTPAPPLLYPSPHRQPAFLHRNEWEPPDKKVDTRKYRAEPKSIFEYEPGKSSVLKLERTVRSPLPLPLPSLPHPPSLSACCVSWLNPPCTHARMHSTAVS